MNYRTFYIDRSKIAYREAMPDNKLFSKFYLFENPFLCDIVAIPDGCVDLQFTWDEQGCRGFACGSFLEGKKSGVSTSTRCFGVKINPGTQFAFLHRSIADLVERRIPLDELLDISPLEKALEQCSSFEQMIQTAARFFEGQRTIPASSIASGAADMITRRSGALRISEMAEEIGYSQRYINVVFKDNYGFSVKKYSDIVRAQAAINSLEVSDIADVMFGLGYYDQAHFIKDFKQYTSLTPGSFIEKVRHSREIAIV